MPPGGRLAYNLPFGRSETSSSLCINAGLRSPRVTSRWRTAATNRKVKIEDVCGAGEDRSSWRMSGSHHRHLAFEAAPTPSPSFSRYTCLEGTSRSGRCSHMSLAAAGDMMVTAEVSRMAVHSATVACKNRGRSESGIKCRGSSSFRVILVAVKPVSFD